MLVFLLNLIIRCWLRINIFIILATAKAFSAAGAKVILCARNRALLENVKKSINSIEVIQTRCINTFMSRLLTKLFNLKESWY